MSHERCMQAREQESENNGDIISPSHDLDMTAVSGLYSSLLRVG